MSAGRFEWEATGWRHRDRDTGALAMTAIQSGDWFWCVQEPSGKTIAKGTSKTAAGAKGAARKALMQWKEKR